MSGPGAEAENPADPTPAEPPTGAAGQEGTRNAGAKHSVEPGDTGRDAGGDAADPATEVEEFLASKEPNDTPPI